MLASLLAFCLVSSWYACVRQRFKLSQYWFGAIAIKSTQILKAVSTIIYKFIITTKKELKIPSYVVEYVALTSYLWNVTKVCTIYTVYFCAVWIWYLHIFLFELNQFKNLKPPYDWSERAYYIHPNFVQFLLLSHRVHPEASQCIRIIEIVAMIQFSIGSLLNRAVTGIECWIDYSIVSNAARGAA